MAGPSLRALGLMSGTSMDGIDAAILDSDGDRISSFGPTSYQSYSADDRAVIRKAMDAAQQTVDHDEQANAVRQAEFLITERHRSIVAKMLSEHGPVDLIGFHGQTIFHAPDRGVTIQIGDGQSLADSAGTDVVFDMRCNDVAHGGQGAPLAPVYHRAVANHLGLDLPVAMINIGGVANVTWIGPEGMGAGGNGIGGQLLACDTGPGNALMNDWVKRHTGADYDADGALASQGQVDEMALSALLDNPYFSMGWPKSLDRDAFSLAPVEHLTLADGVTTLAAFTVRSIIDGLRQCPQMPMKIVIVGGGAHNPVLLEMLGAELASQVVPMGTLGLEPDFIEAQAFAYCAIRSKKDMPITFPGTTGCPSPLPGGKFASPRA